MEKVSPDTHVIKPKICKEVKKEPKNETPESFEYLASNAHSKDSEHQDAEHQTGYVSSTEKGAIIRRSKMEKVSPDTHVIEPKICKEVKKEPENETPESFEYLASNAHSKDSEHQDAEHQTGSARNHANGCTNETTCKEEPEKTTINIKGHEQNLLTIQKFKHTNKFGSENSNTSLTSRSEKQIDPVMVPHISTIPSIKPRSEGAVLLIIMNIDGPNDGRGDAPKRRRRVLQSIIERYSPALVLFQETKWQYKTWKDNPLPDRYEYSGHQEASRLIDSKELEAKKAPVDLRTLLDVQVTFPTYFDPLPRMHSKFVTLKRHPSSCFLCISWHGPHNNMKVPHLVDYFKYLMEFLRTIYVKIKRPLLIAGDFNVEMSDIEHLVRLPFLLCKYKASERRTKLGVIDYFIITEELDLTNVTPIDLESEDRANNSVNSKILNHDPIQAVLRFKAT